MQDAVTISTRRQVAIADTPTTPEVTGPAETVEEAVERQPETKSTN